MTVFFMTFFLWRYDKVLAFDVGIDAHFKEDFQYLGKVKVHAHRPADIDLVHRALVHDVYIIPAGELAKYFW